VKPIVCLYSEGNDTKVAVVEKEKGRIRVLRTASLDVLQPALDLEEGLSNLNIEGEDLAFEDTKPQELSVTGQNLLNAELKGINLNECFFIPALTEPSIYYHIFEGSKREKSSKLTQDIADDIMLTKNISVDKDSIGYTELADKSLLTVFLGGEATGISLVNSLARYNGRRYYKIPSVKSAEISLAYYVAKRKKFFPDDHSLIVYIGKEYSKLIFLHGRKLKHIGSTLDIGTLNLHTYDVYFSKILLEMENGGITSLDNIIVCGEDDSENLILSFYGTFPEANVSRLEFDDLDLSSIKEETKERFSSYSVPIAVAVDYFDEEENEHKGINLLPRYVKEDQKTFQFAWHGYAIVPLLFAAAFFITLQVLNNNKSINKLDQQIAEQTIHLRQNQEILGQIADLESKISGFDQTQAILDSAAVGSDIWNKALEHVSDFFATKKNIWLTKFSAGEDGNVVMEGFALSKRVLTEFAYSLNSAQLKGVFFESLREKNTYRFNINFNLSRYLEETK
jgi:hypothetical protein